MSLRINENISHGILLLILQLTVSSPAEAYRMFSTDNTGRLVNGIIVNCDDPHGFAHWENHNIPWRINRDSVTPSRTLAVTNAMDSWSAVPGSTYSLTYSGATTRGWSTDGVNTILWTTGNGCEGGCLARTALVITHGQVIVESDIMMRSDANWTTDIPFPPEGLVFDTEAAAAHELGHSMGIHHTENEEFLPTMMDTILGVFGRTLETDDENAIRCSVNRYGPDNPGTDITYRAHVRGKGWLQWVQNGATGGTTGQGRRMEAAEIRIKNGPPGMGVCYSAYVHTQGWQNLVCDGALAGTIGEGLRMEAIRIYLTGFPPGCGIEYRAHVQGKGWLEWVLHNEVAGTTNDNRRMEALEVRLTGTCG